MKNLLILLIAGLFTACSATRTSHNSINSRKATSSYEIKKIIDEGSFFVIYATRNDSTFKIICDVEDSTVSKGKKIEAGKSYHLDLEEFFPTVPNLGIAFDMGNGKKIHIEKKSHYTLYNVLNLNGLYLKK